MHECIDMHNALLHDYSSTQTTSPLFHTANPADQPVSVSYRLAAIELVVGAYPCRRDSTVRWYVTKNSNVLERDPTRGVGA